MVAELRTDESPSYANVVAHRTATAIRDGRAMLALAKEELAKLEADFIDYSKDAGIETVELADGTLVTRVDADRRKIDAVKLADLTAASTFENVTERKVNHKRFDAAVELGAIPSDVVAEVVTATPYNAIRITKS